MIRPSTYIEVTDEIFKTITLDNGQPTVAVFGSENLGGMSMMDTIMESLAPIYKSIYFFRLDDQLSDYTEKYGQKNKVSICFLKNGEVKATQQGLSPKSVLKEKIALLE